MGVVEEFEQIVADIAAQIQWERDEIVVLESPSALSMSYGRSKENRPCQLAAIC